jgi:asparagine synthase (glutamine-hydrolysing)
MLEFDKECRRLLKDIHYFDVLRSDRSISSNGLEARTPFLDRNFVQTYLSIPYHFRCHSSNKLCEKYLLRKTFDDGITLPDEVLWRTKEAFSDGVSNDKEAWFETINNFVKSSIFSNDSNYPEKEEDIINMMIKEKNITHNLPTTLEQLYYRLLFEKHFPNKGKIIPYFWMPTYGDTKDASARTLDIYKKVNKNKL